MWCHGCRQVLKDYVNLKKKNYRWREEERDNILRQIDARNTHSHLPDRERWRHPDFESQLSLQLPPSPCEETPFSSDIHLK